MRGAERIQRVHKADWAYGAARVTAALNDPTAPVNTAATPDSVNKDMFEPVNHKRVARVMRERRIVGLRLPRKDRATIADRYVTPVPDLLKRDFTAPAPNMITSGTSPTCPTTSGTPTSRP